MATRSALAGTPMSPGLAAGPLFVAAPAPDASGAGEDGLDAFRAAARQAALRLRELAARIGGESGQVLEGQALIAADPALESAVATHLRAGEALLLALDGAAAAGGATSGEANRYSFASPAAG